MNELLTTREAASLIKINPKTLLRYINQEKFEDTCKIGNAWRIPRKSLDKFIKNSRLQGENEKTEMDELKNINILSANYSKRVRRGEY